MILTILREEYLALIDSKHSQRLRGCAAQLIQLFKWTSKDGLNAVQLTREEIRLKLLEQYGKDAIASGLKILQDELEILRIESNDRSANGRNGQVKTLRYFLNYQRLVKLLLGNAENSPLPGESGKLEGDTSSLNDDCSPPIDIEILSDNSFNTPTTTGEGGENFEETTEVEFPATLASSPFIQDVREQESSPTMEPPVKEFSAAKTRELLQRLRNLGVPLTADVLHLVSQTPEVQLALNITALEEEAEAKGLRSPLAAAKHFIKNNLKPRDERQSWWSRAAAALGKERLNQLISAVTEYAGAVRIFFANGRHLTLQEAQGMTWEAIAQVGTQGSALIGGEQS